MSRTSVLGIRRREEGGQQMAVYTSRSQEISVMPESASRTPTQTFLYGCQGPQSSPGMRRGALSWSCRASHGRTLGGKAVLCPPCWWNRGTHTHMPESTNSLWSGSKGQEKDLRDQELTGSRKKEFLPFCTDLPFLENLIFFQDSTGILRSVSSILSGIGCSVR